MVPAAVVACNVNVLVPQIEAPLVDVSVGDEVTVMVTVVLTDEGQAPLV
jgi:hypothetical protein